MAKDEDDSLEKGFSERFETLASLYDTDAVEMSSEEVESLTPILNSLKDPSFRYRELKEIAEGGEKRITLAHDHRLDRRIAMARSAKGETSLEFEQFLREARLTANLAHPNIMPVYNMGLDQEGTPFFSMELIPGDSLKSIIRKLRDGDSDYRREYSIEALLNIFLKVCDAIAYAHSRDVLHLDIKPDNIRVGAFGEVLVCDWGLARVTREEEADGEGTEDLLDGDVLNDMTLSGTMKGTPGFMAPEQTLAKGEKTERTDIYALGALLYVLLTHKLPVEGKSANEVVENTRAGRVVAPRRRGLERHVPKSLAAVMMKALSLAPMDRYPSVMELRREIARFLSGHPTLAEHAGPITRTSLLLQRHSRVAFLLIFFLLLLASVISANLVAISREKAEALVAKRKAETNFKLYQKEQEVSRQLGEGLGEAVSYTVRSRDFVNAASMIQLLETGLSENIDTVKRRNLHEQKGILHFVLQEFNAANDSFEAAGKSKRIGQLRELSLKFARVKPVDSKRLTDDQLADLMNEGRTANQMTIYYLYYHHMRRRPALAKPEQYTRLAGAVLDKLNYTKHSQNHPLKLTRTEEGTRLDLSNSPYTIFSINIIGVYRRNVIAPFRLRSLDVSGTKLTSLNDLRGMKIEEINVSGVPFENRMNQFVEQALRLGVKRIVMDVEDFPEATIEALSERMEIVDASALKKKKQPVKKKDGAR